MKLAIPIFSNDGKIYTDIEIRKPKTEGITAAYEAMQGGNVFRAMQILLSWGIESILSTDGDIVENQVAIKAIIGNMAYPAAEAVALEMMCLLNKDDTIEGVYSCPRCDHKVITENNIITGEDNRDKVSEINCIYMEQEDYNNEITVNLNEPVVFKNAKTDEIIETINNFAIRYPTLTDCIIAGQNMQSGQEVRMQLKIYVNALIKVNGDPIDKKWIANYGNMLINKTDSDDLEQISKALLQYGIVKTKERICSNCGKVWEAPLNTANFFVSGLRAI